MQSQFRRNNLCFPSNIPSINWIRLASKQFIRNIDKKINIDKYKEKLWRRLFEECEIPEIFWDFSQEIANFFKDSRFSEVNYYFY